ncbi:MAG: MBL fold metallo-hydrolase [Rubritepida sp.]|jgi:glyoxylase-like metal-dependent hydrolase (beta-lactamase superfamily II)|nr:MBL fold metallo-hydrolase [Rubritepida sp.]MCU0944228.1 MBL fold metallo-hydrolase [Rubritepida sp.]
MLFPRRGALGAAAALTAAATLPLAARAAAPQRNDTAPAWYRFRVGNFEATVISDGHLPLGKPTDGFPSAPVAEMEGILRAAFLPADSVLLEQNVLVVNTGRQVVLFDTGMGESMGRDSQMFGPTTGRMLRNLRAAGIEPAQVDVVALTHAHCDHCWGLVDAQGNRVFPNAQVAISEADLRFWTDDANRRGPAFMNAFVEGAQRNLRAYRDRMIMVRDGAEVVPGITAIATPGHTVGHHVYAVTSEGRTVVNTGDLAHHHAIMLAQPSWEFAYDTDPALSARSRTRFLERAAGERLALLSYHFPWPGLGHVGRQGQGFVWVPAPMNVTSAG